LIGFDAEIAGGSSSKFPFIQIFEVNLIGCFVRHGLSYFQARQLCTGTKKREQRTRDYWRLAKRDQSTTSTNDTATFEVAFLRASYRS
jgi:hypothetical protein